ncbi:hypothetical protein NLJ89_g6172 [Agrocybe chaxingu]|uniref:Uncharacterized protein n=1 Tax=Agrocybe chaxingu TaxID=84603 RepID=A0A9W8MSY3_9AGAR|nr:hypothetical protein NLJ89_g6172 [Agrocybe chaxingu]
MKLGPIQFIRDQLTRVPPVVYDDLEGKHVVVVGANVGLGFEAAKHFARMDPAKLILACRSQEKGEAALRKLREETGSKVAELWLIDLADFASVKAFVARYEQEGGRLDLLVENAAIAPAPKPKVQMTTDGWEPAFQTNNLSTSLLGLLLLPRMLETAKQHNSLPRLAIVSSDVHYWSKFGSNRTLLDSENPLQTFGSEAYCTKSVIGTRYFDTKLLNVLFTRALADRLHNKSIIVDTVNPGYCYSELRRDFTGFMALFSRLLDPLLARTTEQGARQLVWAAVGAKGEEDSLRGAYVSLAAVSEPSDYVISKQGREDQNKLWDNMIGILGTVDLRVRDIVENDLAPLNVRTYYKESWWEGTGDIITMRQTMSPPYFKISICGRSSCVCFKFATFPFTLSHHPTKQPTLNEDSEKEEIRLTLANETMAIASVKDSEGGVLQASAQSGSSQVLANQDILSLIFNQFLVEPLIEKQQNEAERTKYREGKKHLLWAALVSRAFAGPALNSVWRRMETLLPLFKILPNFDLFSDIYTFKGPVSDEAIDRFNQYALRIQILDFCEELQRPAIASHTLLYLSRIDLPSPLLPALHSISIHASNPELTNALLFIRPTNIIVFSSFKLDAGDEAPFSLFLIALSQGSPDLQRLRLEGDIRLRVIRGLARLSQLQDIDLELKAGSHTENLMENLAAIPSLSRICITIREGVNVVEQSGKKLLWFPALNSLSITGDAPKIRDLVACCRLPRLAALNIAWTSMSRQAYIDKVLETTIHTLTSATSCLNTLCLAESSEMDKKWALSSEIFDLPVFSEVQKLSVFRMVPWIWDGQVQDLAESGSWKSLQVLDLPDFSANKFLTLRSLKFLAMHCPDLKILNMSVYVDTESLKSLKEEMPWLPVPVPGCCHGLEKLHLGRWNDEKLVGNAFSLGVITAHYIDRLFPVLTEFGHLGNDSDGWWHGIRETIDAFHEIRREERLSKY